MGKSTACSGFMRLIADVLSFEVMNHPLKLHAYSFTPGDR